MTKEQLQEYRWIKKNIQYLEEKLIQFETIATKTTAIITDMPRNPSSDHDKITNIVYQIIKIKNKISDELQKSREIAENIESAIESLDEREKYLMRLRYIKCLSWDEISHNMSYGWAQIHRIHGNAIEKIKHETK